ncbi:CPBP family intramembrane glutamic endopeptidase [Pseudozobellia thermophila]|nr:CPBP family intramembrane glutamic endopeptidase [Pseudozobellia thermophila]
MINETIGAILQILVFTLIPFLVYIIKNKSPKGFLNYIGLKQSTKRANYLAIVACLLFAAPILILTFTNSEFKDIMFDPNSITGKFRQMGLGTYSITLLLITAVFKTSLSEEIIFRGFIAKRLVSIMGFVKGNVLQAALFGIIHTLMFALITTNIFFLLVIFIIPSIGAYVSVYLNEKIGKGSIVPGWISHGLANIIAYGIVGFVI